VGKKKVTLLNDATTGLFFDALWMSKLPSIINEITLEIMAEPLDARITAWRQQRIKHLCHNVHIEKTIIDANLLYVEWCLFVGHLSDQHRDEAIEFGCAPSVPRLIHALK
jgi:hypothetical protein